MTRLSSIIAAAVGVFATGCASGPPLIDQMQPEAVAMATRRGQFELDCPTATGQVISRLQIPPLVQTFAYMGPTRDEYTVGVSGCGKRATYTVICPENGNGCYASGARYVGP